MESKHMLGPWKIQAEESALDGAMEYWVQNANGEDICSLNGMSIARIIAAAPELLEALLDALHLIETISPIEGDTVRRARAAIAKATGQT